MIKTLKLLAIFSVISASVTGCSSLPEIPQNLSSTQLIQSGQDAIDSGNYKAAEAYYMATIQRYGTDTKVYIETRYELGRLYINRSKWEKAYMQFSEILGIYENAEPGSIPASYKKLSLLSIDQIPEKYRKSTKE